MICVVASRSRHLLMAFEPVILKLQLHMAANLRKEAEHRAPSQGVARHRRLLDAIATGDPHTVLDALGQPRRPHLHRISPPQAARVSHSGHSKPLMAQFPTTYQYKTGAKMPDLRHKSDLNIDSAGMGVLSAYSETVRALAPGKPGKPGNGRPALYAS